MTFSNLMNIFRGHGTYFEDGVLYSSVAGITDQVNKLLRVKTVKPRFVVF
jgi:exosome complex RNA-binding protein Rrp4